MDAVFQKTVLGINVATPAHYSPELLVAIERQPYQELEREGIVGFDRWNAFEFSWLNKQQLPQVGGLIIDVPQNSEFIVESKSLKLYLNGFYNEVYESTDSLCTIISDDLAKLLKTTIEVKLQEVDAINQVSVLPGICLETTIDEQISNQYHTHLFRSLCPVTSQPDWASIIFQFDQPVKARKELLEMVIGYRQHQGFHENCVELMFEQIGAMGMANNYSVQALFCRRGGIDINPFRSTTSKLMDFKGRSTRQ